MPMQLYEYHVPGDYLGGDGGVDSDYDEVRSRCQKSPLARTHAHVIAGPGLRRGHRIKERGRERGRGSETGLKEAPQPASCKARIKTMTIKPSLPPSVPLSRPLSQVTAPNDFYGTDQKGDAAFGDLRGFGPADRHPTYQGEYHEYEGGDWTEMKGAPQQLAQVPCVMMVQEAQSKRERERERERSVDMRTHSSRCR